MLTRQINKYIKSFAPSATVRRIACGQHKRQIRIIWNPMTVRLQSDCLVVSDQKVGIKKFTAKARSLCLNQEQKSGLKLVSKESWKKSRESSSQFPALELLRWGKRNLPRVKVKFIEIFLQQKF